jgi:hypothetical protein
MVLSKLPDTDGGDVFTLGSTSSEEEYEEEGYEVRRRKRHPGRQVEVDFEEKQSGIAWKFADQGMSKIAF